MRRYIIAVGLVVAATAVLAQSRGSISEVRSSANFQVAPAEYNATLFGRQRVANSYNLADIINTYGIDPEIWGIRDGGGAVTALTNESAIVLAPPADGGWTAIETHSKFRYQAAHAHLVLQTFSLPTINTGATPAVYRVGYYDDNDGLFWQADSRPDSGTYGFGFVRRTSVDGGIPVDNYTSITTSFTSPVALENANVFEERIAWLGVHQVQGFINGTKRFDEVYDGRFQHVYMKSAFMPLRAEVGGAATARLKYICSSVQSEGGMEPAGTSFSQVRATPRSIGAAAGILPIIAIRPAATFNTQPSKVQVFPTHSACAQDTAPTRVYFILNPTLTGASFTAADPASAVEYSVTASAYSGGTIVAVVGGGSAGAPSSDLRPVFNELGRRLRVRAFGESVDTLLVAVDALSGTASTSCSISWTEVR